MSNLKSLDLANSNIHSGGNPYQVLYASYNTVDNTITNGLFAYWQSLEELVIPRSVTKIGKDITRGSSIKKLIVPENIEYIEESAFYSTSSLEEVTILSDIKEIPDWMFDWCNNLKNVQLPQNLEKIGVMAFRFCHSLQSITFPQSLKIISSSAFEGCQSIEVITIPADVCEIGRSAFDNCRNLKELHIKSRPEVLTKIGAKIADYENVTLYIPKGSKEDYFYTDLGNFKNIVEE